MRKFLMVISVVWGLALVLAGCEADKPTYSSHDYIMFSDTLYHFPVQDNEEYFNVPVSAMQACDYDRTFGVEVVDRNSNAIEGKHYALESNTVTIKAGELATNVRVRGFYENIGVSDSLGFALRLVTPEDYQWDVYGTDAKVVMQKVCPFDINAFTGYCVVTSTYMMSYMQNVDLRLIRSEKVEDEENAILLKNCFYNGYDIKVKLTTDDILNPLIEVEDGKFGPTADAFGTIYGDGMIRMYQPSNYVSYYSSCENFILMYSVLNVLNKDGSEYGVVGTFVTAVEWISEDEAKKLQREGYPLN